jgi:hypothetical protein
MISAKATSHAAMMFAALWIIVCTILKGLEIIKLPIEDIILSGGAVAGIFCPTFISIWLDKIAAIKWGKDK